MSSQRPPPKTIVYDVAWLADPDVGTVDALARLQLAARRARRDLLLRGAGDELRDLLELMGLRDVLRIEPGRQAEQREQVLGVQEERDPGEPVA